MNPVDWFDLVRCQKYVLISFLNDPPHLIAENVVLIPDLHRQASFQGGSYFIQEKTENEIFAEHLIHVPTEDLLTNVNIAIRIPGIPSWKMNSRSYMSTRFLCMTDHKRWLLRSHTLNFHIFSLGGFYDVNAYPSRGGKK